jgi:aminomethyltransferase
MIMAAGEPYGIKPATPNAIERIETGLLSYGSDMTLENNPFEVGLGVYCDVDQEFEFIGRSALQKIRSAGVTQKMVGLILDGEKIGWNSSWWPITRDGERCGKVTSAIYSLALQKNIAFAILPIASTELGTRVTVHSEYGDREATVVELPFVS